MGSSLVTFTMYTSQGGDALQDPHNSSDQQLVSYAVEQGPPLARPEPSNDWVDHLQGSSYGILVWHPVPDSRSVPIWWGFFAHSVDLPSQPRMSGSWVKVTRTTFGVAMSGGRPVVMTLVW